jgi:hypothetical protein
MAFIADTVFDNGLTTLDPAGTRLDICSTEPTTYTEATSTYSVGYSAVNTGASEDGGVSGRRVVIPAISTGSVTVSGTAAFWALTDGSTTLYATGSLAVSQSVTAGNTFSLDTISITIRDA